MLTQSQLTYKTARLWSVGGDPKTSGKTQVGSRAERTNSAQTSTRGQDRTRVPGTACVTTSHGCSCANQITGAPPLRRRAARHLVGTACQMVSCGLLHCREGCLIFEATRPQITQLLFVGDLLEEIIRDNQVLVVCELRNLVTTFWIPIIFFILFLSSSEMK